MTAAKRRNPVLYVLAGVNGAGKSSIGEGIFNAEGSVVFNPDTIAARIRSIHPDISASLANAHAWQIGKALLEQAMADGKDYRFETTLGGNTIPQLLREAVRGGHLLNVWFCGLDSPERHIARVRARVARGGHAIPEEKIRERWDGSRKNLIRLLPLIHHLRLYDNSFEAPPTEGQGPRPVLLLEMKSGKIIAPADLSGAPDWAKPILAAAMRIHTLPEL
ncbi:MAG: zeta toxin family protein [Opitutales bacterium]|nr:zeta toxin family protein [Opitutales bacterium]